MDMEFLNRAPEQKAGVPAEPFGTDDVMSVFEAYKQANDERLAAIEKRKADPLLEEKMARMDARLDSLTLKAARPALGGRQDAPSIERLELNDALASETSGAFCFAASSSDLSNVSSAGVTAGFAARADAG